MAMMNALTTAVSGMKSSQTGLDVIANNIANVNTPGYKAQTVTFSDLLSQTIGAASSATATRGGVNPQQVGLGVQVASTSTDMTVGSTSSSSSSTDVALTGEGYFIVQTGTEGDYQFTRNGGMSIDEDGNLNIGGYKVCGWESYTLDADGNIVYNTDGAVEPLNLYSDDYSGDKQVMAAKETTYANYTGAVDSSSDVASAATGLTTIGDTTDLEFDSTSDIEVYDAQGNKYDVTVDWKKCYVEDGITSWYWQASSTDGATISPSSGYVAFDSSGKMVDTATVTSGTYNFDTTPDIVVTPPTTAGTDPVTVSVDFSKMTTTSGTESVSVKSDGYESGTVVSNGYNISQDGTITATYSNGQTKSVGQIALAVFDNPSGLEKVGDNFYDTTTSSGDYRTVVAGEDGSGTMTSYALELSNVDLSAQFSAMMISERAYQANSKVISTSDDMLQSLINMVG